MPGIRDTSFAYESVTTDAGLTIPMCAYAEGDLLFAFLVGDTGTPTVGVSSGGTWNQLFQRVNTCSLTVLWKYAAASEPDVVLTSTVNETYSGCLVSVRDVFQGYTLGSPPLSSNTTSTGTRIALPTITTSAANSLVLAVISSAAASSFSFVEDALQDLVKVDGAAEGLGVGWFFKKAAGLTTAYNASSMSSQSGGKAVIEVRAPAGGATVIPAYPVSDASIYLGPSPRIAFDSNVAMIVTNIATNYGTPLNGKTVVATGTVADAVDIGLDKGAFMSMGGITNAATANSMSGAEFVVAAARYNIGTRNIQTYFRHPTPAHNQRLTPLSSGRGVWMGMRSGTTAATNLKVWQVHGGDAALVPGYVQPITIAAANTDTIASAGTLSNADVRSYAFYTSGIGVLTNQSCFGPLWAMDTTVLAGGNAAEPMDIPRIIAAAALNKVRFSSLLQGSNQMLCSQAIQFGDGGTNATTLQVNGGAVEFPSRKNAAKKIANYNGTDDSIGWTFYPGASDTIDLEGTAFASASKYHWRIHASASGSATYNLNGVVINGAGDVQLRAVTPFAGMSFASCPTIYTNGATLTDDAFTNSKLFVSTPANAALISNSSFAKTAGTSHALEIGGTAADITLSGLTFTGYAGTDGSTGNEAIFVNIASGSMTINIAGGGSTPSIRTAGATVTVVNAVSLTITGWVAGAILVIYDKDNGDPQNLGTELQRNNNVSANEVYSYAGAKAGDEIMICLYAAGYKPLQDTVTLGASSATYKLTPQQETN